MIQDFKVIGRKYQVLPNFGICCRELGGLKLKIYAHACAVSVLPTAQDYGKTDLVQICKEFRDQSITFSNSGNVLMRFCYPAKISNTRYFRT